MIWLYYAIAGLLYALSASLPYIVTKQVQLALGIVIGIGTSICWTLISRAVSQAQIPLYGLLYDAMLTIMFFIVPFVFIEFNLTWKQILGVLMTITGLLLIKV